MSNFTDILPPEIILKILKHMNHSDLISFGLTSKKCKDLAVDILRQLIKFKCQSVYDYFLFCFIVKEWLKDTSYNMDGIHAYSKI